MIQIYYSDATGNDIMQKKLHTKFVRQSRSNQVDCWVNSRIWFDCTPGMGDDRRGGQKYGECITKLDNQT